MTPKKQYIKPEINRISLDSSISAVMLTTPPIDPPPHGGSKKSNDTPFESPFGDKPFS